MSDSSSLDGRSYPDRIVVINDVAAAKGGATGLALESIRLLRDLGIPITFIVGGSGASATIADAATNVVSLGGSHIADGGRLNALARGIYNRPAGRRLSEWIERNDTASTVYHVHGWSKILSPSIFHALRPVAARTIVHAHDFFLACPNGAFQDYRRHEPCDREPLGRSCLSTNCDKRSYAQKLWRVARQKSLFLASSSGYDNTPIVMIHDDMRPFLELAGYSGNRLRTIRNPIAPFCDQRVQAERNTTFYFVGRVEAEKGVFELAEAARRAGVTMRMIGDGPDRAAIEERYPEIDVTGWLNREAIGEKLADARALVMPSLYREPFGLVAMEASASGLPVILSENALLARDFSRCNIGFDCDPTRIEAFAEVLRTVAKLPESQIKMMSETAFARPGAIANTPTRWRDELLGLYTSCIERSFAGNPLVSGTYR